MLVKTDLLLFVTHLQFKMQLVAKHLYYYMSDH